MNVMVWGTLCVMLLVLAAVIFAKYQGQRQQIRQIEEELSKYLNSGVNERIMLVAADAPVQKLLVATNQLIDRERELLKKQRQQDESNRKMLSNISHDLKTPLTVILGYAELLNEEQAVKEEKAKQKLWKIQSKARDVLVMIEEFFDVMKIESGEFAMNKELIDLCEICREQILEYYSLIEASDIRIETEIAAESIMVKGDRLALKRILANLIENAIRYGSAGKYLKVAVHQEADHKYIEVIDHGKGITEDSQEKVFERLFTLEDCRNKKYQGSGLGLTITKRLVEAMDGNLTLESRPYQETKFTVKF